MYRQVSTVHTFVPGHSFFPEDAFTRLIFWKIFLMLSRTEGRRGSPWYMSIAYSKGNGFEENCPCIFYGFRASSTYDLGSGHNMLPATSDFHVSLLAFEEW